MRPSLIGQFIAAMLRRLGLFFAARYSDASRKLTNYVMAITDRERLAVRQFLHFHTALGWRCAMRLMPILAFLALSSMWGGSVQAGPTYSPAEVAYVSEVSGRVVAFEQGKPMLLDVLDVVADQTQLDLLANSELQICHSRLRQIFVLKGPLRAMISQNGVRVGNGKVLVRSTGTCATPTAPTAHGGLVSRAILRAP
jgi:hypothetical protein